MADDSTGPPLHDPADPGWDPGAPPRAEATGEAPGELPDFPTGVLPGFWRPYVDAIAETMQVAPCLPAMLLLSVWGSALHGQFKVRLKPGYTSELAWWSAVVLGAGESKSPVMSMLLRPIYEHNKRLRSEYVEKAKLRESAERVYDHALRASERKPDDAKLAARLEDAQAHLDATPWPGHEPVSVMNDFTPEALAQQLAQQGAMLIATAEGDEVFQSLSGRYTGGRGDTNVLKKGYDGEPHRVDRKGGSVFIDRAIVSMAIAVQPGVVAGLEGSRQGTAMRGEGFLARFAWAQPHTLRGRRKQDPPPVAQHLRLDADSAIARMLEQQQDWTASRRAGGDPEQRYIELSREAWLALCDYIGSAVEPDLAPQGDLETLADWANKHKTRVARVAALLHAASLARNGLAPDSQPVSSETMQCAIQVGEYLLAHAEAMFAGMPASAPAKRSPGPRSAKVDQAVAFLRRFLTEPKPRRAIVHAAKAEQISESSVDRARRRLDLRTVPDPGDARRQLWCPPDDPDELDGR